MDGWRGLSIAPGPMTLRLPIPLKVLLSYLAVVAVGAVPTFFYLRQELTEQLIRESATRLAERGRRMARLLDEVPAERRLAELERLAVLTPERLTLIAPDGEVLFETHAERAELRSHADRPEVQQARSLEEAPIPGTVSQMTPRPGVGIAHRVSDTTGIDSLYVAVRLPGEPATSQPVLRVARRVDTLSDVTDETVRFLGNAQAVAISLALGLSLLAALVLVRPLIRLRTVAEKLASGDFGAHADVKSNDEIGDLGRALVALAAEMRRRMATSGAGEAMLVQLVDVLDAPVVVFQVDGDVIALNGAARKLLAVEGPGAGQRIRDMLDDASFQAALQQAEEEGAPEPVVLRASDGAETSVRVFVLKRPGSAPLGLMLGPSEDARAAILPPVEAVSSRALADLLGEVRAEAERSLGGAGIELDAPRDLPGVQVADAEGRLAAALLTTLTGCAPAFGGRPGKLSLDVEVEDTRVAFALDAAPPVDVIARVRPLVEPLGGTLDVASGEATLWLPRA